ncbi:fluoride efflux transporter FluC [Alicyclobacillus sp. ALC3]|uniref:fluoride efflux transporter FluC n=1 Tax=Alicyclobacillus sp. ALC3 TaxID=2796143 RepID=UPI0023794019|nr:CrcB family protein [Alicyclobacillus sp. ALC3]WDL99774.1 CrcB family protein [Alicyclobacillus sp. ALC3]
MVSNHRSLFHVEGGLVIVALAIMAGGFLGGFCRYLLQYLLPTPSSFPLGVLVINLAGSFLLGLFYALADTYGFRNWIRAGIGTGGIGAFTTFSTFAVGISQLVAGHILLAVIYAIVSSVGGVLSVMVGEYSFRFIPRFTLSVTDESEEASM